MIFLTKETLLTTVNFYNQKSKRLLLKHSNQGPKETILRGSTPSASSQEEEGAWAWLGQGFLPDFCIM